MSNFYNSTISNSSIVNCKHSKNHLVSHLVRVGKAAHAAHDTEHVVVGRIHTHRGARGRANRVVGHRQEDGRVINTRQVARA